MFKSSRKKAVKAKEKVTFKLELHASGVPQRGWDKLLVSLVSLNTGKVTAKTEKVPVKNGTCQWSESLFEASLISQDSNGKDAGKELYRLVVSMGLSRFGILGETTINLVDYLQAATPVSLPLPLQSCNFGSILHVKIQRIMPKSASRDLEDQKEVPLDQDSKPATPDGGQQTEFDLMLLSDNVADSGQGKPSTANKDDASPLSTSCHSFDSVDIPSTPGVSESCLYGRDGLGDEEFTSPSSSLSSSGRHEAGSGFHDNNPEFMSDFTSPEMLLKPSTSVDSYSSTPYHSKSSPDGNNGQNEEWNSHEWGFPGNSSSVSHGTGSYDDKNRYETSQRRTRLQRTGSIAAAASWERDGNQVVVAEVEVLKQKLADETKRSEEVHKKLSVLMAERDSIKQEMENLKSLENSPSSKAGEVGLKWQQQVDEDASRHAVELQDELDYEKSMNLNLSLRLRKTQESNSELLLEIQDLENLLQEKKLEKLASENKPESGGSRLEETDKDLSKLVDTLQKELEELERDSQELTEENLDLISQLKQANDKMKDKDDIIAQLEIKSAHTNKASDADCIAEPEVDKLREMVDDLREKLRASEEARVLHEVSEHDYRNTLEQIKELEAANQKLEKEKSEAIITLEKQLKETEEQASAAVRNYDDVLQVMGGLKAERVELDREMSVLLEARKKADASESQLQNISAMLQEQLHQEQLKTSKILQQSQEHEAKSSQLYQALNATQAQVKSMEQMIIELETVSKQRESEVRASQEENRHSRSQIKELELHTAALEDETHSLKVSRSALEAETQDLKSLKERFKSQEEAMQSKAAMEEKISHLQEANVKGSRRPLEEKNSEFKELLQKQTSDLTRKLSEQQMEQQELKMRVFYLEEELQRKVNALASAEKKLKEQRELFANGGSSQVSYLTRSLSRANSRIRPMSTIPPSREAKELSDLREKVKLLEGEVQRKAAELEASKQQLKEQHTELSIRIEHLELANEEIVKEHSNSNVDQH